MRYKIENCANSVESAVKAQEGGAYRVELCAGIPEGGTTPSFGDIVMTRKLLNTTKLNVIIRPRGGDFLYSQLEQEIMLQDIEIAKQIGVDGVVFGCLTADGDVDMKAMEKLIEASQGLSITFHRAFDVCSNPFDAIEKIISLGCNRILTSGQKPTALQGADMIKQLVDKADGRIIIMPGCGVNPSNIKEIAVKTGAHEFHFSGRSQKESGMRFRNTEISMGGTVKIDEYRREVTDSSKIKSAIDELKTL